MLGTRSEERASGSDVCVMGRTPVIVLSYCFLALWCSNQDLSYLLNRLWAGGHVGQSMTSCKLRLIYKPQDSPWACSSVWPGTEVREDYCESHWSLCSQLGFQCRSPVLVRRQLTSELLCVRPRTPVRGALQTHTVTFAAMFMNLFF